MTAKEAIQKLRRVADGGGYTNPQTTYTVMHEIADTLQAEIAKLENKACAYDLSRKYLQGREDG